MMMIRILMQAILSILSFAFLIGCSQTFKQFIQSTPDTYVNQQQRFGLITVTYARKGSYDNILSFLSKYGEMECPQISQIVVVWNNQNNPEDVNITKKSSWRRPIYFRKTPYNSMNMRFLLPQQSKAKIFFSLDDQIAINCKQLLRSFDVWKQNAVGDLGPVVSYAPNRYTFNSTQQVIECNDHLNTSFFTFALIGVGWISRFYLELYYSPFSYQMVQSRKIIEKVNNCDDVFSGLFLAHFFPQIKPVIMDQIQNAYFFQYTSDGVSRSDHYYKDRKFCFSIFTNFFSYLPTSMVQKFDPYKFSAIDGSYQTKYILYLKKRQLRDLLIDTTDNKVINKTILQLSKILYETIAEKDEQSDQYERQLVELSGINRIKQHFKNEVLLISIYAMLILVLTGFAVYLLLKFAALSKQKL